tara:strand:+ start:41 stop:679 length:639 start_codon:yes stop_codon:yes gene_type:complete
MSELKINQLQSLLNNGTTTIGKSGDTITIPSGATLANSGTTLNFVAADIVKMSSVTYSGRATHSGANSAYFALTGLNLTHQAASTSNRLLFIAQIVGAMNPGGSSWSYRFVDRTNSDPHSGNMNANAQGSRERCNTKGYIDGTSWGATHPMMAFVTPASTNAIQYGIDIRHQHADWVSNGNYDNGDTTTVDRSRGLSTFTILEFDSGVIKTG